MSYCPQAVKLAFSVQKCAVQTVTISFGETVWFIPWSRMMDIQREVLWFLWQQCEATESDTVLSSKPCSHLRRKRGYKFLILSNNVAVCPSQKEYGNKLLIQKSPATCYLSLDRNCDQNCRPCTDIYHSDWMKIRVWFSCFHTIVSFRLTHPGPSKVPTCQKTYGTLLNCCVEARQNTSEHLRWHWMTVGIKIYVFALTFTLRTEKKHPVRQHTVTGTIWEVDPSLCVYNFSQACLWSSPNFSLSSPC